MSLGVGILGFGRIGAEHGQWISAAAGVHVAAIADPTPARRQIAEQLGLPSVADLPALLGLPTVAAVLVCTPTAMHFEQGSAALSAGKHLMLEKPMALDLDQARQLSELADRHHLTLSVFHNRRFDLDFLTVRKAVASGVLGRVFNVESRLGQWASCVGPAAPQWHPQWRNEAAFGGGGLYDWGSHFLDQLWQLMLPARPMRLYAQLRGNIWTRDCDDLARVCIDFDDGAVGLLEINTTTRLPLPRWHLDGSAGSAHSPYSLEFDVSSWAQLDVAASGGSATHRLSTAEAGPTEIDLWRRFADAVREQRPPAILARSVLPTMALLDAARQSSRSGRAVDLPAELFSAFDEF